VVIISFLVSVSILEVVQKTDKDQVSASEQYIL